MIEQWDRLLKRAIADRRLVTFTFHGCKRIGEPHDYGIKGGVARLFFYQTGGQSRSGRARGWRWAELGGVSDLVVLDETFEGPRDAPSGRHIEWDSLIASVSAAQRKR
jgi:hypothetical protein